ncbi:MAG: hypothetical protein HY063_13780 [Bacteroidetes bacterium]|nr:hypothetical protein [Bacteroidota bacterium]
MKKKYFYIIIFLFAICHLPSAVCHSQEGYFYHRKGDGDKYFVSLGYGEGTAHWKSVFRSTEFYDKDGRVINTGDFEFGANSPTKHYDMNVMAPIKHIRLGMGICFEHHYLSQLKVYAKGGEEYLLFDESLRFDKIYFQSEIPFNYESKKKYSFNWNFRGGWYGYTNVKRFNFIGEKPFPIAILATTGLMADYEIYPSVYIFAFPNFEYKFYDNARTEAPVQIRHSVFTASIICGVRIDMGKFHD